MKTALGNEALKKKAQSIRFLLLDVDGVLTNGMIYLDNNGNETKAFHIHDGFGIYQAQKAGIKIGIVTGRSSEIVSIRANELEIQEVHQGIMDKITIYDMIIKKYDLSDDEIAYVGDDLIDLPVLKRAGLSIAVANARPMIKEEVDWVTNNNGGNGAVREVTDFLLSVRTQ